MKYKIKFVTVRKKIGITLQQQRRTKPSISHLSVCTLPELDHDSKEPIFTKSIFTMFSFMKLVSVLTFVTVACATDIDEDVPKNIATVDTSYACVKTF